PPLAALNAVPFPRKYAGQEEKRKRETGKPSSHDVILGQDGFHKTIDVERAGLDGRLEVEFSKGVGRDRADARDADAGEFIRVVRAEERCKIPSRAAAGERDPRHLAL